MSFYSGTECLDRSSKSEIFVGEPRSGGRGRADDRAVSRRRSEVPTLRQQLAPRFVARRRRHPVLQVSRKLSHLYN
jgi:hypothetical protein